MRNRFAWACCSPTRARSLLRFQRRRRNRRRKSFRFQNGYSAEEDSNLRGFALNQAGPRDSITGFPVGGQALLVINQELRFPLKLPYVPSGLGGAFFYDGGNAYSRVSRMTLRWASPKPVFEAAYPDLPPGRFNPTHCLYNCTNELNYFSHTIGFGLRYATPVGPIRVDLGYRSIGQRL